ncbi:hypothetical protein FSARC_7544 [Fusarium sarcochroum]|uniref:Uncharacterized protein n=1 Tax=Fusarium sarcochroum TaxID=1208366 RepID=A0A8H4X857_9HYPO|nr:hypothetical protein FSARC_7544 [Fusarium sarcochroum]
MENDAILKRLDVANDELRQTCEAAKKQAADSETRRKELVGVVTSLTADNKNLRSQVDSLRETVSNLEKTAARQNTDHEKLKSVVEDLVVRTKSVEDLATSALSAQQLQSEKQPAADAKVARQSPLTVIHDKPVTLRTQRIWEDHNQLSLATAAKIAGINQSFILKIDLTLYLPDFTSTAVASYINSISSINAFTHDDDARELAQKTTSHIRAQDWRIGAGGLKVSAKRPITTQAELFMPVKVVADKLTHRGCPWKPLVVEDNRKFPQTIDADAEQKLDWANFGSIGGGN